MKGTFNNILDKVQRLSEICKQGTVLALDQVTAMKNCHPNSVSIVWMLLCIRICFGAFYAETAWMEYLLWGAIAVMTLKRLLQEKALISKGNKQFFLYFAGLIGWMLIGCLLTRSFHAIKTTIIVMVLCCFILEMTFKQRQVQICYFRVFYAIVLFALLIYTISGVNLGNTIPGCMVFLTCGYVVAESLQGNPGEQQGKWMKSGRFWMLAVTMVLAFVISWESSARTASLVVLVIVFALAVFSKVNKKYVMTIFYVCVAGTILFTAMYAFIRYMPFFEQADQLSKKLFQKSLDSSRPGLWRTSLAELSWWQWLIGKGTGILPSIERYDNSSFHNSYIQLLMQNGVVGLAILYALLGSFWKKLAAYAEDNIVKFVLATFVGIMVYNCFETTLLQNKTFLGIVQWLVLMLGLLRCKQLQRKERLE